jgi:hypothetical protein
MWYLAVIVLIIIGTMIPMPPSAQVSPMVQRAYDKVAEIQPGEAVMCWMFWRSVVWPTTDACFRAVFTHAKNLGGVMIFVDTSEESIVITDRFLNDYWGPRWQDHPAYGTEFVYLGYVPGTDGAVYSLAENIRGLFPTDYEGTPLDDMPATADLYGASDFKIALCIGARHRGFVRFWYIAYGVPCIGMEDVGYFAYIIDMWVAGIAETVAGARMGAEYEALAGVPGESNTFMGGVFLVTTFAIGGMIVSNINYFRRRSMGEEET